MILPLVPLVPRALAAAILGLTLLGAAPPLGGESPPPPLPAADRVRLAEAQRLAAEVQEQVWPGWSRAPLDLLLVAGDHEYLVHGSIRPPGFAALPADPLLGEVLARPRVFDPNLLATFPAFGGPPTIVVGAPAATGKSSTAWVVTLLHEHFHQLQYSDPDYYPQVGALDLAGGDQTGMWMLDYPFPYDAPAVADLIAALRRWLAYALAGGAPPPAAAARFWTAYGELRDALAAPDYRYLSFQLWQEGIARYTELRVAEAAAAGAGPGPEFRALPDYAPYDQVARELRERLFAELRGASLTEDRRVVFYGFGAALGLLLDAAEVDWKSRYLQEKFYLERYAGEAPP